MLKNSSSKAVKTVSFLANQSVTSSCKSSSHYSIHDSVASVRSSSDGKYHSKRNLKAKAIMFKTGKMSKREFIGEISGLVMRAARAMNCRSYDWRYDFYLYIISRIDNIMECYTPNDNFEFETWFIAFLKKRYISFIRLKKSKWINVSNASLTEIFNDSQEPTADNQLQSYSYDMLDYSGLSVFEEEIIKARYGILDKNALTNEQAGIMQAEREKTKQKLADQIAKKYARLLDIRSKMQNADDELADELRSKEQKILQRKRVLENRYNNIKTLNSLAVLCKMYNISRYALEQTIKSAENKLYQNNYYNHRIYEA